MDFGERVLVFWVVWAMIGDTVKAISLRVVGYVIVAALLLYAIGKVDGWLGGNRDAETTRNSAALLKIHAAGVRWRAKLAAAELVIQAEAAAAHDSANTLRASVAGLPIEQRPPRILVQIATKDSTAYAKCAVALRSCEARASLAEYDNRQLAFQLAEQMKVRDHRCGVFVGYGVALYNAPNATARTAWELAAGCRIIRFPFLP